ncbi:unnamed protein product [Spirodela intermedia]|uniref:Uncharacterized protein n=1 Tax=Spirodela intermedia TaxID=51605 RepID=A0A7I8I9S3_SPIIN|nr:unnamed protein product [Spirodela intermedia]CAA6654415.1 unnamed protein product [Spirodela intermedia]
MATRHRSRSRAAEGIYFLVLTSSGSMAAGVAGVPTGKQQKAPAGANRRALGDIGIWSTAPKVDQRKGMIRLSKPQQQISRPVTRSFGALLLKNAQAAAEAAAAAKQNTQKPVKLDAEGREGSTEAAQKGPTETNAVEIVPTVTAAESSLGKKRSSRKKVHTFSSVLSARSKVACGIALKPAETVPDIDAADVGDQLAVADYVEDIYKFYKLSESSFDLRDYMGSQIEINAKMRAILVDWLIEVHYKFELMPETLYLTVYIIDRYLSLESVLRRELQLVGITAMLIACKYEEIWAPEINDFICISDNAYGREQILGTEKMENLTFFFAELGLMQYSSTIPYCPSMVAAAAVYAARETLRRHAGFSEAELRECARLLLKAVYKKYSSPRLGEVALHSPAMKLLEESPSSSRPQHL